MTETSDTTTSEDDARQPRRNRPEWVSIVIEFFTMSATLVLLIAFVLGRPLQCRAPGPGGGVQSPPRGPHPVRDHGDGTTGTGTTGTDGPTHGQTTQPTATDDQEPTGTDTSPTTSTGPQRQFDQGDGTAGQQTPQSATGTQQTSRPSGAATGASAAGTDAGAHAVAADDQR